MSNSLRPHESQHARPPCPITNSQSLFKLMSIELVMPSNHLILCHHFSSCFQSFPASGSFPMKRPFASGSQRIIASASVLPINIQGRLLLGLTGLISLQSKGLLRIFSNTTVQKHQFFCAQLSLWSNSYIFTWLLENHSFNYTDLCWPIAVSTFINICRTS